MNIRAQLKNCKPIDMMYRIIKFTKKGDISLHLHIFKVNETDIHEKYSNIETAVHFYFFTEKLHFSTF